MTPQSNRRYKSGPNKKQAPPAIYFREGQVKCSRFRIFANVAADQLLTRRKHNDRKYVFLVVQTDEGLMLAPYDAPPNTVGVATFRPTGWTGVKAAKTAANVVLHPFRGKPWELVPPGRYQLRWAVIDGVEGAVLGDSARAEAK